MFLTDSFENILYEAKMTNKKIVIENEKDLKEAELFFNKKKKELENLVELAERSRKVKYWIMAYEAFLTMISIYALISLSLQYSFYFNFLLVVGIYHCVLLLLGRVAIRKIFNSENKSELILRLNYIEEKVKEIGDNYKENTEISEKYKQVIEQLNETRKSVESLGYFSL
jgi:hypothetical protein